MKNKIIGTLNMLGNLADKHLPVILNIAGTGLFVASVVKVAEKTPETNKAIIEATDEKGEVLTITEKAKIYAVGYKEPIAFGVGALGCFYGAQGVNSKRIAALASAYSLQEVAFKDYVAAAEKVVGKGKTRKIREQVNKDSLERNPVQNSQVFETGDGDDLCYDKCSGRYFKSSMHKVYLAFDEINMLLKQNDYVRLNELYSKLGIAGTTLGEYLGWDLAEMSNIGDPNKIRIDVEFDSAITTDGRPCLVIDYLPMPIDNWRNWDRYDNQFNYGR